MATEAVFYVDGLCEPRNPGGVACYGWVGYWQGKRARSGHGVIGEGQGMTNNVAEYSALIAAMEHLIEKGYKKEVEFKGDSQLLINQMNECWNVNSPHLLDLWRKARKLADNFSQVIYTWIPREQNDEADRLSRVAYQEYRKNGR